MSDEGEQAAGGGVFRDDRDVTGVESVCEHASVYMRVCVCASGHVCSRGTHRIGARSGETLRATVGGWNFSCD